MKRSYCATSSAHHLPPHGVQKLGSTGLSCTPRMNEMKRDWPLCPTGVGLVVHCCEGHYAITFGILQKGRRIQLPQEQCVPCRSGGSDRPATSADPKCPPQDHCLAMVGGIKQVCNLLERLDKRVQFPINTRSQGMVRHRPSDDVICSHSL